MHFFFILHRRVEHLDDKVVQMLITEQPNKVQMVETLEADRAQRRKPQQQLREPPILGRMLLLAVLVQAAVDLFPHVVDLFLAFEPSNV